VLTSSTAAATAKICLAPLLSQKLHLRNGSSNSGHNKPNNSNSKIRFLLVEESFLVLCLHLQLQQEQQHQLKHHQHHQHQQQEEAIVPHPAKPLGKLYGNSAPPKPKLPETGPTSWPRRWRPAVLGSHPIPVTILGLATPMLVLALVLPTMPALLVLLLLLLLLPLQMAALLFLALRLQLPEAPPRHHRSGLKQQQGIRQC